MVEISNNCFCPRSHCASHAFAVPAFDVTSFSFKKEVTKKVNQNVPSWNSLSVPLYKDDQEIDIKIFCIVLQVLLPRAAGGESMGFCQGKPILGVRSCAQDGGGLTRQKAPAALEKPSGGGVPRGIPLVPFLATSWGMPRSSIGSPAARCAAGKGKKTEFQTTFPTDAHTAARVRCTGMDAISLSFHKEMAKEKEPKAAAFGNCSFAALQRGRREIT
ncbi:MAG: hypothetical protein E7625_02535 [Ruminococcaceae bacterium]|nr:hypothetical protein [Oscillospiraceae bacterium]